MKVGYTPRALADLAAIQAWLADRSAQAAPAVLAAIRDTANLIGEYPEVGRATDIASVRLLPVVRYPYLVYYAIAHDEVVIVHVRHGARAAPEPQDI